MKIPCNHCSTSGSYIDYIGYPTGGLNSDTTGTYHSNYQIIPCKYCKGLGWIDEDEIFQVPRKYIKDKYFDDL